MFVAKYKKACGQCVVRINDLISILGIYLIFTLLEGMFFRYRVYIGCGRLLRNADLRFLINHAFVGICMPTDK